MHRIKSFVIKFVYPFQQFLITLMQLRLTLSGQTFAYAGMYLIYRIAGNIGGEQTLAVWWCKFKFVNIKSVKLKIRYKPHAIVAMLK